MKNIKRIHLLPPAEVVELYARPRFNGNEQKLYFSLNEAEQTALNKFSKIKTRVYFILQLGYFKAKQQFFIFDFNDVESDTAYIIDLYCKKTKLAQSGRISRDSIRIQKQLILAIFNYRDWVIDHQQKIELYICHLLRLYPTGHSALRQLLSHLDSQKIIIPSYRKIQDMFTQAFSIEESRLDDIMLSISKDMKKQLSVFIAKDDGISQLNIVRADQKDFQFTAVRNEVDKAGSLIDVYQFSKGFVPTLRLSKNAIRHYADVAEQYSASRLRRLSKPQQWLHAMCFIYHRYQQIMDNLIVSFMYHTRTIVDSGKTYAEVAMMKHSSRVVVDFPKLAKFLKWFPTRDSQLTHDGVNQAAYDILPENQFSALATFIEGSTFDKKSAVWEFYAKSSRMFSLYLRPIFMSVSFEFYKSDSQIMSLMDLLKKHYSSGKSPSELIISDDLGLTIPKYMTKYLKRNPKDEKIDPYLFEFFIYLKMFHQIGRGRLFCNDSVSYCDIDHDLVNETLVDDIDAIAEEFGYAKIPIYCDQRLDDAIEELDTSWSTTVENIELAKNPGFNLKEPKNGLAQWSLRYDSYEKLDDIFFKTLPKVEIADVVMYIGGLVNMWDGFTHLKDRYTKRKQPVPLAINACLLSEAFGIGSLKMADMSNFDFNILRSTREDFIRVDTLCAANDIVSNHIHSLPIFTLWNLFEDKVLADADGQKFSTSDDTIQSRYSKKYLGKGRGISLYTLIANYVAANAKNIGLNEYEGHFLYDMIYGNKTDIEINMVTGDNHSLNKLNFVALDSINVDYVPSIKNVRSAADDLYSVEPPDKYTGVLRPKGAINIDKIRSQKRGILRVLLSLILQENTQSNIIRKLNSHARYARLNAALFEYNNLFKSIHILNLIDDMNLRKAIRTARNRTEAYHQLQGSIRKVYTGVFKGKKIADNRVSAHAARLIANCIIAYNSIILNSIYEKMLRDNVEQEVIDKFARISPIAWIHLLFTGRYSFKKSNSDLDVESMARIIEEHLKQSFWSSNSD